MSCPALALTPRLIAGDCFQPRIPLAYPTVHANQHTHAQLVSRHEGGTSVHVWPSRSDGRDPSLGSEPLAVEVARADPTASTRSPKPRPSL